MARETILIQIPPGLDPVMASNWRKVADALRSLSKIQSDASSGGDSKGLVLVSVTDTTPDHLLDKVSAGANVTITQSHTGYDEKVSIASSDETVKVSSNDTTEGYLATKLIEGSDIDFVETSDGSNETLVANFKLVRSATAPASPTIGMLWQDTSVNGDLVGATTTDEKAKVSANDTTSGYLNGKLVAGTNITLTEGSDGSNETLTIASTASAADEKAKVSANDTTAGYLNGKLVAGTSITLTEGTDGGNEILTIASTAGASFATNFSVYANATTSVETAKYTKVSLDTTTKDTNTEWVVADTEWVCKADGTYIVNACIMYPPNGTGYRALVIYKDGVALDSTYRNFQNSGAAFNSFISSVVLIPDLVVGNAIELYAYQNSGSTLTVAANARTCMQIWRIA